jgi:hypothetical protein
MEMESTWRNLPVMEMGITWRDLPGFPTLPCLGKLVPRQVLWSKLVPRQVLWSKLVPRQVLWSKLVPRQVLWSKLVPRQGRVYPLVYSAPSCRLCVIPY